MTDRLGLLGTPAVELPCSSGLLQIVVIRVEARQRGRAARAGNLLLAIITVVSGDAVSLVEDMIALHARLIHATIGPGVSTLWPL